MESEGGGCTDLDHLSESLGNIVGDETTSDVTIFVQEKPFRAHKAILAARSKFFRALFYNGMNPPDMNKVELKGQEGNLSPETFRSILGYIYTGKFSAEDLHSGGNVVDLLGEAMFFGLDELVKDVIKMLKEDKKYLPKRWAFILLPFAWTFDMESLKQECIVKLEDGPDDTLKHEEELSQIPLKPLTDLFARDTFAADEVDIFSAVATWIKKTKEKNLNLTDEEVKSLLNVVRLENIPSDLLLEYVEPYNHYSDREIIEALKMKKSNTNLSQRGVDADVMGNSVKLTAGLSNIDTNMLRPTFLCIEAGTAFPGQEFIGKLGHQVMVTEIHLTVEKITTWSFFMMVSSSDYDAVEEWTTVADFRRFSFRTNSCRIPIERRGVRCVRLYLATADNSNLEPGDITVILLSQRKNADWRTVDTDGRGWPLVYYPSVHSNGRLGAKVYLPKPLENPEVLFNQPVEDDLTSGVVSHAINQKTELTSGECARPQDCIIISLGQPFYIGSIRFLLPNASGRSLFDIGQRPKFQYRVFTSNDMIRWEMVADKTSEDCSGWQRLLFDNARIMTYILLQGTKGPSKTFGLVYFECPDQTRVRNADENEDER